MYAERNGSIASISRPSRIQRQIHSVAKVCLKKSKRLDFFRHTFAVHCLNSWVLVGEDLTAGLPVLSTYLGHNDLSGTQRYLQLTAQMYPDITQKLEKQFGELIPTMEVPR